MSDDDDHDGEEPDFEIEIMPFSELFNGKEAKQFALMRFINWTGVSKNGDIQEFEKYLVTNRNALSIEEDKMALLHGLIKAPESFKAPMAIFEGLTRHHVDFQKLIENNQDGIADGIWAMCKKSPRPEIAQIAAVMAAEYLRFKISRDDKFTPDFTPVFQTDYATGEKLTMLMDRKAYKDSIIMTQHALVDAVKNDQYQYPLNRGIPFLALIADTLPAKVTNIWTKKLEAVKIATKFNVMIGDVVSAAPVYAP